LAILDGLVYHIWKDILIVPVNLKYIQAEELIKLNVLLDQLEMEKKIGAFITK